MLENPQHHGVIGNLSLGWKSCVSATVKYSYLQQSFTTRESLCGSYLIGKTASGEQLLCS